MRTIYRPIFTLHPYKWGNQATISQYSGFVMPELGLQIPLIPIIRVRADREDTMDIEPQPVVTKDKVEILVDGVMWVRPTADEEGIKRTFYSIDNWKRAVIQLAMTNLRQEFGELLLNESLIAREKIATNLQRVFNGSTIEWGLTVSKVEIRLIDPPDDIKRAMHTQKTTEQKRRSMKSSTTGEFEAAQQQKLANIQHGEDEREAVIQLHRARRKRFVSLMKPLSNTSLTMLKREVLEVK